MEKVLNLNLDDCLRVGTYVNTHGVRGDIKVYPHTDDITRFSELDYVYMKIGKDIFKCDIKTVKYHKNMAILGFKGIDNINDIEKYKGADLFVTRDQAVPLDEGEYFICDVIGAKVVTDNDEELGLIKDVLQTGANDVYVVTGTDGKEILLPVIPDCVLDINTDDKIVKVHVMPGLID